MLGIKQQKDKEMIYLLKEELKKNQWVLKMSCNSGFVEDKMWQAFIYDMRETRLHVPIKKDETHPRFDTPAEAELYAVTAAHDYVKAKEYI